MPLVGATVGPGGVGTPSVRQVAAMADVRSRRNGCGALLDARRVGATSIGCHLPIYSMGLVTNSAMAIVVVSCRLLHGAVRAG
jgi:hypothetical protein